jgi:hypothetical protein
MECWLLPPSGCWLHRGLPVTSHFEIQLIRADKLCDPGSMHGQKRSNNSERVLLGKLQNSDINLFQRTEKQSKNKAIVHVRDQPSRGHITCPPYSNGIKLNIQTQLFVYQQHTFSKHLSFEGFTVMGIDTRPSGM